MSKSPQIYHGEWWVPAVADHHKRFACQDPEKTMGVEDKSVGTLFFNENEESTLELYHVPSNYSGHYYHENKVMWGKDANGHIFTLFDVNIKKPIPQDNSCTTFVVDLILIGKHVLSLDSEAFTSCLVIFPYLENWAIFETKKRFNDSLSYETFLLEVPLKSRNLLEAPIDNNYVWKLEHGVLVRRDLKGYQIIPSTYYEIHSSSLVSIRSFLSQVEEFSQFLSIALYGQQNPERIEFIINGERGKFELLYKKGKSYSPELDSLIKYLELKSKLPSMFALWHKSFKDIAPICSYLVDSLHRKTKFEVPNFLIIAQALDGYYKRFVNKKDGKDIRKYEDQIGILLEQFKDVKAIERCHLNPKVLTDSRNYYSHLYRDEEIKSAVDGDDLYWLTEKCKILLTCCILNMLGLTNEEINLCCEQSPISQIIDSFPLEID